ncbi:glycosyltransferase family 2 protein [Sphingomonas radiodurans]|uniref:glycosyltransferase family 2 protein n=1 Tax=Sphingomonas radiodurans TaxID=2890321 RepID=UPI001E2B2CDA|nr:glycosyltransferase [Sphingomonas radiodurans]WBH15798.1 glycosyltransferase [Sphingomonas radiodurans]
MLRRDRPIVQVAIANRAEQRRRVEPRLGRFSLPWIEIDRDRLERCAATTPEAAITLNVPALGAQLDNIYRPISARTALELAGPVLTLNLPAGGPEISLDGPRVSAVIPNYNYAQYLPERIGSLLAQDTPLELVLLDDASTDTSIDVALATARAAGRELQIVTSPRNSGSVLAQWRRATMLARGRYLLIAEADDVAEPALVATLAAKLDAHPDMAFAFSDSAEIDAEGAIARPDYKAYYAALGDRALEREQVMPADKFLLRFLLPRNLVVNVSAVLWRTAALRAAFERLGAAIDDFRAAGDWRVYIEACRAGGSVGYVPAPLNRFRRHPGSVIGRYTREQHIAEVEAIHALLLSLCGGEPSVDERLAHHRAALRHLWSLPPIMDDPGGTP